MNLFNAHIVLRESLKRRKTPIEAFAVPESQIEISVPRHIPANVEQPQ